jgi:hypothetical protein
VANIDYYIDSGWFVNQEIRSAGKIHGMRTVGPLELPGLFWSSRSPVLANIPHLELRHT